MLLLLLVGCSTLSLKAESPVRFGVVGGLNLSFIQEDGNIPGFHVGGKVEYAFANRLYLESGLLFTRKGTKVHGLPEGYKFNVKSHHLELPIHFGFKFNTNHNVSFFLSGGGYLALGLFGKDRSKSPEENRSDNLYSSQIGGKRFDCGVGFKGGVELFKRVQLSVSYDLGLIDTFKNSKKTKNRNAMFSCAYMF